MTNYKKIAYDMIEAIENDLEWPFTTSGLALELASAAGVIEQLEKMLAANKNTSSNS